MIDGFYLGLDCRWITVCIFLVIYGYMHSDYSTGLL